eukprot:TRINITY_DN29108_c0_g1_i2.p1 TRINITY_DN29108_c0_g1~~TRINITY_DN29108_c0_g1_i2.p1  ORF type:complete len:303 (-),score=45.66 TRINITY_DN29108_c0_g1_i2:32-940(-)
MCRLRRSPVAVSTVYSERYSACTGSYCRLRLHVARVLFTTKRFGSRGEAEEALRQLIEADASQQGAGGGRSRPEAQLHHLASAAAALELDARFQVVLDLRGLLGCRIYSNAASSLEEIILLRRRVLAAEAAGGKCLLDLWREWAQANWHFGGRAKRLTDAQAEEALARAQQKVSLVQERRRRELQAADQRAAEQAQRQQIKIHRLATIAQSLLDKLARASRAERQCCVRARQQTPRHRLSRRRPSHRACSRDMDCQAVVNGSAFCCSREGVKRPFESEPDNCNAYSKKRLIIGEASPGLGAP